MISEEILIKDVGEKFEKENKNFSAKEFLETYKVPLALALTGLILVGFGVFLIKDNKFFGSDKVEVLESTTQNQGTASEIVVEIAGAVEKPGVYKLKNGDRVEDLLIASGGFSADADRNWVDKVVNRAAKLTDGQKLYIPSIDEQSGVLSAKKSDGYQNISSGQKGGFEELININTASQKELESLWGIGPVYAQNIIEQRPYSSVEELVTKKIIKQNVYERNKTKLTVY